MTSIESVTLEVADPSAADRFYTAAFGLGDRIRVRGSEAPTSGFRGFKLSLIVSRGGQPHCADLGGQRRTLEQWNVVARVRGPSPHQSVNLTVIVPAGRCWQ